MEKRSVSLDDKYLLKEGYAFMTGVQALVRLPLVQRELDKQAGLNTAGYISGYRGSPLGGYDQQLEKNYKLLEESQIKFQPGVNEDLAATALWGTQQAEIRGEGKYDGIFGIGINRNVEGEFLQVINTINKSKVPVLSLDIPSGLNADTGEVMGSSIKADVTSTFVGRKKGLYLKQGPLISGCIEFSNLSIPDKCFKNAKIELQIVNQSLLEQHLKPRNRSSHKGDFGHVLVIAGNHGMGGAARITSESALRTGAGIVSVITRPENVAIISKTTPEIMAHSADDNSDKVSELINKADVIAIGPGLGIDRWAKDLFNKALESEKQIIIDADGLNLLADCPTKRDNWILTPHPGEAARLLRCLNPEIQEDRLTSLEKLVGKYGGVTLLKGNNTLIGAGEEIPFVITAGNPGMSTAGMGDLLTGIIAALCSQFKQVNPNILTALAAYIHALAGDQAAKSGERGIIATDLFKELKHIINP